MEPVALCWARSGLFQSSPSALRLPGAFWAERTPIHEAAQSGEIHQLQELIGNGPCINLVTYDSVMPLQKASLRGQTRCVEILLAVGAQVDARNIDGSTPLCDACTSGSIDCKIPTVPRSQGPLYITSPLHEACLNGTPLRLSQLCRLSLRQALGRTALEKISHLHIPTKLVEFLSYSQ